MVSSRKIINLYPLWIDGRQKHDHLRLSYPHRLRDEIPFVHRHSLLISNILSQWFCPVFKVSFAILLINDLNPFVGGSSHPLK